MSVSIKTVFEGNIRRFTLTKPSYDELEQALDSIYGKRGFSIRYQDEDGDMVSVSSSLELQEALRVANGGALKLTLSPGASPVCVDKKAAVPVMSTPAVVVHAVETPEPVAASAPVPQAVEPEDKKEAAAAAAAAPPKLSCDEMRVLACQFLSDPAVQVILPELAKAVISKVVQEARAKQDPNQAAARVLGVITSHSVIQNHPAMATVRPHLGQLQALVARVVTSIPCQFVDLLDQLKEGFQLNADMLKSLLSNPMSMFPGGIVDCGKFDLGALGVSLASLVPSLASLGNFSCGPFEFVFECKSPCQEANKEPVKEESSASDVHGNVRCDGCNVFPIVGPRYNCTVCPDFDLCAKCEASAVHPAEHPLLKMRQVPSTAVVHNGITCDGCQQSPITGIRFKCRACPDYDLCEACEAKNVHPTDHPMVKFKVEKMRHGGHHGRHGGHRWGGRSRWLSRGAVGDAVKEVQQTLEIQADGFFGPRTEQAVKDFQSAHSLLADGIVGPRTRAEMTRVQTACTEKKDPVASAPAADQVEPQQASAPAPAVASAPESPAMAQLVSMGFANLELNEEMLKKHNGDVEQVVAEFLGA